MGINFQFDGDTTVPLGGCRQRSHGREKLLHAFDNYIELKTTWVEFS